MELKIFTDGGSINNPGPAAFAFLIYENDRLIHSYSARVGINTNNFAEYTALLRALEYVKNEVLKNNHVSKIYSFSDSNLMVNQLNGLFKVKNAIIRDFIMKIRVVEQELNVPIVYSYIPRAENQRADSLVKKTLYS